MKKLMYFAVVCLTALFIVSFLSCSSQVPKANLKTAIDSVSYAQGVMYTSGIDQLFAQYGISESNKADFIKGYLDGFNIDEKDKKASAYVVGKIMGYQIAAMAIPEANMYIFGNDQSRTLSKENFLSGYLTAIKDETMIVISRDEAQMYFMTAVENIKKEDMEKQFGDVIKENQGWLEKNKSNEGVVVLPSGLQYKVIKEGKGAKPTATDLVKVNYTGSLINGEVFESVESAEIPVGNVIQGWIEGLQLMSIGSKYVFYIPYNLAYGEQGKGEKISPFATLIFELELLEIVKK